MEQGSSFKLNVLPENKLPVDVEQVEAKKWYEEQLKSLSEYKVEKTPVTGEGGWEVKLTPESQVDSIIGKHFSIEGKKITTPTLSWNQPILLERSEQLETVDGKTDRISGIVLLLKNPEGKIFISVAQQPGVQAQNIDGKEVHPIVRTPFQSSVEKLQQLAGGDEKKDPLLYSVLNILSKDNSKNLSSIVQDIPFKKVSIDGNRIESSVLYGVLNLSKEVADLVVQKNPQGRFLSKSQLEVLPINGHLHIALSVSSSLK